MSEEGTINAAAAAVHEMFLAYIRAGFKRSEALDLVKEHISNLPKGEAHDDG